MIPKGDKMPTRVEERVTLSIDEALGCLAFDDERQVHCFANPGVNMLIGADWSEESVRELAKTTKRREIGGDDCRRMKHGLVMFDERGPLFFAANEAKLAELEALAPPSGSTPTTEEPLSTPDPQTASRE